MATLLEPIPLLRPVNGISNVPTCQHQPEHYKLDEEPRPAAAALPIPRHTARRLLARVVDTRSIGTRILLVQVM
jgi:hypothetical protein